MGRAGPVRQAEHVVPQAGDDGRLQLVPHALLRQLLVAHRHPRRYDLGSDDRVLVRLRVLRLLRGVQDDGVLAGVPGHRVRPPLRQHLVHDDGSEAVDHDRATGPHGPALRHQHARRLPHGVHGDAPRLLQLLAAARRPVRRDEGHPGRVRPTGVQGGVPRQLHRRLHRGGRHRPRRSDPSEHAEGGALRADLRRRLRLARLQPPHRRDARAPHRLPPARLLLHRLLRLPRRRRVHAQAPDRPRHLRRRDRPLVARPRALGHARPQRPQRRHEPA